MKKFFLQIHKYLGLLLSVVFVIWFVSGFVMMFSSFPKPRKAVYALQNRPIDASISIGSLPIAQKIVLQTRLDKLQLRVTDTSGKEIVLAYPSMEPVGVYTKEACEEMAETCLQAPVEGIDVLTDFDMWIPWKNYEEYFPIYRCHMDDAAKTVMYVSSATGEVVQETNSTLRVWSYFGAIPHWVYIKQLRLHIDAWKNTIIVVSALGSVMCLTGVLLGLLMMKRGRLVPYRKRWFRWHHILGLVFGFTTFTYVFSGMMSLCDIPNFIASAPKKQDSNAKPLLRPALFTRPVSEALKQNPLANTIELLMLNGKPYYKTSTANGCVVMVSGDSADCVVKNIFTGNEVLQYYGNKIAGAHHRLSLKKDYDSYYMPSKGRNMPLPVYEILIDDKYSSTYYVNPQTMEQLGYQSTNSRIRRWAYGFLHSFNSYWLTSHPFARRSIEIILMLGGLLLSVTSVALTIRWIRR